MTRRKTWLIVAAAIFVSIAAVAVGYQVYWVAHIDNDTQLLSNENEAYLLIKSSRLGYQRNLVELAVTFIGAPFGISPNETRRDLRIVRVTSTGFERNDLSDITISRVGVFGNRLYTVANCELRRLTGTRFEPTTAEEQALVKGSNALLKRDGWSWRSNVLTGRPGASTFSLGGQRWTIVAHNNRSSQGWTAIDLQKGEESPERVWYLEIRPRYTNKDEYATFLGEGNRG